MATMETEALSSGPRTKIRQFSVEVIGGPDSGASYTSDGDRIAIGSHQSADLRLSDPSVSRFHCEIEVQEQRLLIRDLGSKNGTYVGGLPIDGPTELSDGAQVTIGPVVLQYRCLFTAETDTDDHLAIETLEGV